MTPELAPPSHIDEWCNIPQDQIDNLILSMPRLLRSYFSGVGGGGIEIFNRKGGTRVQKSLETYDVESIGHNKGSVGNKCDSESKDQVSEENITAVINELGYSDKHFLISAFTGENVDKAFKALLDILMYNNLIIFDSEEVDITLNRKKKRSNCSC
ncbi:hypothetical protein TNCV_1467931 [Trichonephila clavipes]|uniref:Uncharacterized protein n=1 Tax=Trichonephila clavipes TaxID=2585209 RepID=A0A8X6RU28_TRICX|nr:hypothetical protein TNCV_1467931 [Trichonephila clavipes]